MGESANRPCCETPAAFPHKPWCDEALHNRQRVAAALLPGVQAERDQLRQQAEKLQHDLAAAKGAFNSLAEASAKEIGELRQQVEGLLSAIDKHRNESSPTSTPQKFSLDGELYAAADQVRKEPGEG